MATSGIVYADYHLFWLLDRNLPEGTGDYRPPANGLVAQTIPGAAFVQTGISSGAVDITVDVLSEEPSKDDAETWSEVVEVSVEVPNGQLLVTSIFSDLPQELPNLASAGPGSYRVRVYANGRDRAVDLSESGVESYRVAAWPAPTADDDIIRSTDEYGATVRART
ncbi:hypothetical protein WDZ92_40520 [Nostoc sp. NIES-2111]|jgi:hypothetical protein